MSESRFLRFERHVFACEACKPVYRKQLAWNGKGARPGPLCSDGEAMWKAYLFPPFEPSSPATATPSPPPSSPFPPSEPSPHDLPEDLAVLLPTCSYCQRPPDEGYVSCTPCRTRMYAHTTSMRATRRQAGLCVACGKAEAAQGQWCPSCRSRAKSVYHLIRSSPLCYTCRKPKEDVARPYCGACRLAANTRRREQRAATRVPRPPREPRHPRARSYVTEYGRLSDARRAKGLCVECGKVEAPSGQWCSACRVKATGTYERLRDGETCARCWKPKDEPGRPYCAACRAADAQRKRDQRAAAKASGVCYFCGKNPPREGSRRCEACIDKSNARSRKGHAKKLTPQSERSTFS